MRSNSGCQSCGICASRRGQQGCIEPWELLHALAVFLGGTQRWERGGRRVNISVQLFQALQGLLRGQEKQARGGPHGSFGIYGEGC